MFGRQAIRLLREAWGGVIRPGPQGEMREKGAKQLAEELYAMFDKDVPLEHDGPITINKGSNATPLTINNNSGGNSFVTHGGVEHTGDFTVDGVDVDIGGDTITIGDAPDPEDGTGGSDVTIGGDEVNFEAGDIIFTDTETGETETLDERIERVAGSGGGGGGALPGIVTGGEDQEYEVDLYADGYDEDSTSSEEGVLAPAVADGEAIDAGTKLPVFRAGDVYYLFPPVWL
jgi:hypothetical protein